MSKDYLDGASGRNMKFKKETLLNYAMNRWGLNKAASVGATSELIRSCSPDTYKEWEDYYFFTATQKKKNGAKITREYLDELGQKLYMKLSEVVQKEIETISEEECIDYVYNLVLNRTYEGYRTEIETIYGQLQKALGIEIKPAPDIWDRKYSVDFYIELKGKNIGLQIKPVSSGEAASRYKWEDINKTNHEKFKRDFGGNVFYVFSVKQSEKKTIANAEIIQEIKDEIRRIGELRQ
ncbi:MAG: MjaI family restriction endonuclease [Oscillospiraceae bacterium]|nr:MjaI family restriction endonuclease [Oscillospiraceae bacterium]